MTVERCFLRSVSCTPNPSTTRTSLMEPGSGGGNSPTTTRLVCFGRSDRYAFTHDITPVFLPGTTMLGTSDGTGRE